MLTRTLKGKYCEIICRREAFCMLARKKRHIPRTTRPHNRNPKASPTRGTHKGIFHPPMETSSPASCWNPNKSPSAAQPDKKTNGCMKNGRACCASCLIWLFGLIPNLLVHRGSMRRSIHLLNGEIFRVQFIVIDE